MKGELPTGWEWKRLGDIVEVNSGVGFPLEYQEESNGEIPVYKVMDISKTFLRGEKYLQKSGFYISKKNCEKINANPFKKGTVVFAKIGAALLLNRRAILSQDALFDNNVMGLTPNQDVVDTLFLYYHFLKIDLGEICHTTSIPSIRKSDIEDFQIPLPPLPIQRQIVAVLEQAEAVSRQRREADALTGALLQSVFIKMFDDPVSNPKGWDTKKLGDLCTIRRGASPRPIDDYLGGTVPWIKIGDGTKGSDIFIDSTSEKIIEAGVKRSVLLKKGSLIFANCGVSLGFARILNIDGCIHDGWLSLEDIDPSLNKIYLLKLINGISQHFRNIAPDGTQPNLNTGIMKNFLIPLPPLALQQQFAHIVESVERIRDQQVASGTEIEGLCEGLMQRALAGELVA